MAGVNWASKILPVRVLGKCGGTTSDIADGMRWAAGLAVAGVPANANPAKVLNLSLGGSGACGATYQDAINAIVAAGTTVVVSAGNSNADASGFRPANCNGVVTVAATNRNGSRAYYSNYGATVEISAPGGETNVSSSNGVLSTLNTGTQGPVTDTYTYYQGTSMAAPHVAGVASLILSRNPCVDASAGTTYMQSTVTAFPGGSTCNTSICGSGIVNAGAAVAAVPAPLSEQEGLSAAGAEWLSAHSSRAGAERHRQLRRGRELYRVVECVDWRHELSPSRRRQRAFSSPETRYSGAGTSWNATGKAIGTYNYRVQASNSWGSSGWSRLSPSRWMVCPPVGQP